MTLDLTDPAFIADPYPMLAELRAEAPMVRGEHQWFAATHDAVSQVLRHRSFGRLWTDLEPRDQMEPFNTLHRNQMMENEGQAHRRLRNLVSGAFGRGHVERMRPRIETLATEMVARLGDSFDVLGDFAEPMPVFVIADLLGVPREDHESLRGWSQAIVHMYETDVSDATRVAAVAASEDFAEYVRGVIEFRRGHPGEDLITDLLAARDGAGPEGNTALSDDELVASVVLLLNAGHEASVNTFGNGLHALLSAPDQLGRITSGEVSVETALEEMIRFDAPLQLFERTATADVEIAGATVAAGEKVACLMGSANRDATVFAHADQLDVGRDPNPHVGFGMGRHFCLGAPLARLELQISLTALLDRFPRLELVGEAPRRPTWVLRGYESIPLEVP